MPLDADRLRIEQDLRGQIEGEVRCDDLFVQLYASDASIYEVRPLGVVRPRSLKDIVATVKYAAANEISLHARGSGSGLAGESLGQGLILDFSRFYKRYQAETENTIRIHSGLVLDQLNEHLARKGHVLGPDPANHQVTTVGGMAGVDAAGSRWRQFGSMRDRLLEVEAVLADGQVIQLARRTNSDELATRESNPAAFLAAGVKRIVADYAAEIEEYQKKNQSLVNRSGYRLTDLVFDDGVDLLNLLAGSEGTLALFTKLTLRTSPLPKHVGSVLFFFNSMDRTAEAAAALSELEPLACDLMDRRHLSLARQEDPRYELLIPAAAEAVLLVEQTAETRDALRESLSKVKDYLIREKRLAENAYVAEDSHDHEMLRQLASRYVPTLYRLKGATRPIPFVEDIAVPPLAVPNYFRQIQKALNEHHVTASLFGHVGHGQLHIRPFLDLSNKEDVAKMQPLAEQLYEEAWAVGGTISGEHGDGLSRTPYLGNQYGPLMNAFRDIKQLFDPDGILNPGKKVFPSTNSITANLRRVSYPLLERLRTGSESAEAVSAQQPDKPEVGESADAAPPRIELQLDWQPEEMTRAARMCNGCAACRTQEESTRMCPIFHVSTREEASPRAKANLARGVLTGTLPPETVLEDACKEVADLCIHCHMCRKECPAEVDIPKLMVEAKASHVATNGLRFDDWAMIRIDRLCRLASRIPSIANWALSNRITRWMLDKTLGIAQGRKLPYLQRGSFLQAAASRKLHRPQRTTGEKVLLFVDTYANYCDTELANALVAVLEHNGISVFVPKNQRESAMPMISQGVLAPARQIAEDNVALLSEAVRQGYKIISPEPSAVLAIIQEYPQILGADSDAAMLAEHTFEACHYLWKLHQRGKLQLNFQPTDLTVGYHMPCHVKALDVGHPAANLLELIPGVRVRPLEKGCSGMAGLYGVKRKNYRRSLRMGLPLITELRHGEYQAGVTECSTCRLQMEQGAPIPTVHPVKVLALAYNLMPELQDLLSRPDERLRVR
ncbi:MAG: anaerobic glycerol-3-phosphate dehydrogenase subunit C [Lacipirellulaceae bacterium]